MKNKLLGKIFTLSICYLIFKPHMVRALKSGVDDVNTSRANATVNANGCSGTLIAEDIVLTSGHCFDIDQGYRPKPVFHDDFPHSCRDWQHPDRWYDLGRDIEIRLGYDSENWAFTTTSNQYSIPGCVDILMVRLNESVPESIAIPAPVLTRQRTQLNSESNIRLVGWGNSKGLEDLLSRPATIRRETWNSNGHANLVTGMAFWDNFLYAVTEGNTLWSRVADESNISWRRIGRAEKVVGMAAMNGRLFAATSNNRLITRPISNTDIEWEDIGHAVEVTGMTALNNKLYVATSNHKLWVRDPILSDVDWLEIGHANNIVSLAATNGKLFGATSDNTLWAREPDERNIDWQYIGQADRIRAMAANEDLIFAAQQAPSDGEPDNSRRFRQTANALISNDSCLSGTPIDVNAGSCMDLNGTAEIRGGDSGGPAYWIRGGRPATLVGVARQGGQVAPYVDTYFINTPDEDLGTADVGQWIEIMASPTPAP